MVCVLGETHSAAVSSWFIAIVKVIWALSG